MATQTTAAVVVKVARMNPCPWEGDGDWAYLAGASALRVLVNRPEDAMVFADEDAAWEYLRLYGLCYPVVRCVPAPQRT